MKISFLKIFNFSNFRKKKKLMKMNPPGSFSMEGKKKISRRGSGWGVTLFKNSERKKRKSARGVADQMDLGRKETNLQRGFGVQENRRTPGGGKKSKGGKGVRGEIESRTPDRSSKGQN